MDKLTLFSSPYMLGFDRLERIFDRASQSAGDGYPPYNVEQTGENAWRIVLAVAGFSPDELEITLEDNLLTVAGAQTDGEEKIFLHRGIAARQFQRRFALADEAKVTGATLENGLLAIDLVRPEPESQLERIKIKSPE